MPPVAYLLPSQSNLGSPQSRTMNSMPVGIRRYLQGGGPPFVQTTVEPGGTTMVFGAGGGGLLLLTHPARQNEA